MPGFIFPIEYLVSLRNKSHYRSKSVVNAVSCFYLTIELPGVCCIPKTAKK